MFAADTQESNVVKFEAKGLTDEQLGRLKAEFGDKSQDSGRAYRNKMTLDRYTLMERFELGLLNPGAYCQLALEMDEIGRSGPEKFDIEDFIDRWKVSTGFTFNKKTGAEDEKFKKLSAAVVSRELIRLEKVTKTSIVQELVLEIDYNQGYEE
jgi:hypothetical protein